MIIFAARLIVGALIGLTTFVAAKLIPEYAGPIGWTGATLYFWVVVLPKGWTK